MRKIARVGFGKIDISKMWLMCECKVNVCFNKCSAGTDESHLKRTCVYDSLFSFIMLARWHRVLALTEGNNLRLLYVSKNLLCDH